MTNRTGKRTRIIVTYDNNPYKRGLETAWGFSCVVTGPEKTILFDTGGGGPLLMRNMEKLRIDPKKIDVIVLSHIHGDHVGGLNSFLERNSEVSVYVPKSFPKKFKDNVTAHGAKIIEVRKSLQIFKNLYSTGELGTWVYEQSLITHTDKGIIVITGCAHPGVVNIVSSAKGLIKDDVLLVVGGFHLMGESKGKIEKIISSFRKLAVRYVGPCHCSGDTARQLFAKEYQRYFIDVGVGKVININDLI